MKKLFTFIIIILAIIVAWYLVSPIFINQTVDEGLPVNPESSSTVTGLNELEQDAQTERDLSLISYILDEEGNIISNSNEDTTDSSEKAIMPEEGEMVDDIIVGQDVTMNEPMMEEKPEMSVETRGSFVGADRSHQGEGDLVVIKDGDSTFLRFENFSVTNGPDLFVTLNKGSDPKGEHVIVAALKGNQGNQNYDISEYIVDDYDSVSIYCRAFSVEFATAQL